MILLALVLAGLAACFLWGLFPEWTEARLAELVERLEQ